MNFKLGNLLILLGIVLSLTESQDDEIDPIADAYQRGIIEGSKRRKAEPKDK